MAEDVFDRTDVSKDAARRPAPYPALWAGAADDAAAQPLIDAHASEGFVMEVETLAADQPALTDPRLARLNGATPEDAPAAQKAPAARRGAYRLQAHEDGWKYLGCHL